MGTKKRQQDTPLIDSLAREFYGFSFFEAVNLIESMSPDKKPLGTTLDPGEEAVRFSVKPGLAFPASDISDISRADDQSPVNMEVTFMGLIGPSGVLPHWYNELALERARNKDNGLPAFFDIFHHRLISLFYLAWKKHRLQVNYLPEARDRLSACLASFLGLGTPGLAGRIGFPEESLIFYSGLLSRQTPSAVSIEATMEYFTGTRSEVEQFIDYKLPLSPDDQTRIGLANGDLGVNTVVGSYVWDNQTKFRINLGAMDFDDFVRFQPSGDLLGPVFSLLRYMVGIEYEFEIRLILKREAIPPCVIGMTGPKAPRLGWSTWVKHPEVTPDHDARITFQEPQ